MRLVKKRDDPVTGLEEADEGANGDDLAGAVGAGHARGRGGERIHALSDDKVAVIEGRIVESDEDFFVVQLGTGAAVLKTMLLKAGPCSVVHSWVVAGRDIWNRRFSKMFGCVLGFRVQRPLSEKW